MCVDVYGELGLEYIVIVVELLECIGVVNVGGIMDVKGCIFFE